MKALFKFLVVISIFITAVFVSGCKNSYENMIGEFNEKYFEKGYLPPQPYSVNSSGFVETAMLDDICTFSKDTYVQLIAPDAGDCKYEWKALVPQKDSSGNEFIKENVIGTERTLVYEIPGVFNTDKENKLILTIVQTSGKQYTDTAKVFIDIE